LHEGHLSLARRARKLAGQGGKVVLSIYVNPTQFGPREDFSTYPRDFRHDMRLCKNEAVDVVFAPADDEMYPQGEFSTYVIEENLSAGMEGKSRPTHFRGVTTVVAKLFNIVQPTFAIFGAKDYQQAAVVNRMVKNLNFPVKIDIAPTWREADGLAMSSRNRYLDATTRPHALVLWHCIENVRGVLRNASSPVPATRLKSLVKRMVKREQASRLDYVEFFDPATLVAISNVTRGTRMAIAVFIGKTRLIDNAVL